MPFQTKEQLEAEQKRVEDFKNKHGIYDTEKSAMCGANSNAVLAEVRAMKMYDMHMGEIVSYSEVLKKLSEHFS